MEGEEGSGNGKTSFQIIEAFDETLSQIMDKEKLHALLQQQGIVMVALPLLSSQLAI